MATRLRPTLLTAGALALASAGSAKVAAIAPASAWQVGPLIDGRNHSIGVSRASSVRSGVAIPISPTAEPHYVTIKYGSLRGKRQIRMRFRVEGPPGATIYGARCAVSFPSAVTLYFQRAGDDWATDGERWWATFAAVPLKGPIAETEVVASLDGQWTSVSTMTAANRPDIFADAKANADRVGFTFGNCEGSGHGARSTAPVRFVITRFEVR